MSSIHFESTYDNSKLIKGIKQDNQTVGQWAKNIQTQGAIVDNTFRNITRGAEAYLSLRFAARISQEIIQTRGQFQQLGIAFETMLGSKEKADKLLSQSIQIAQKTPFTLLDVTSNIKQLLAMGITLKDVTSTLKDLGDVAAGVSVPLSRIAINYGQVATLGRLQQRELRDFAMAGIPLMDELAKNMGKSKEEIQGMITAGRVGFKDVERAFQTMAGEGGKFYNLMEKQNASVTGQISNLQDKLQVMLNSLGKANEGLIYGGISGLSELVTNYEDVLDVLKVLAGTYGTYKAAIIAVSIYEKIQAKNEAIRAEIIEAKVIAIKKSIAAEEAQAAAAATTAASEKAAADATAATASIREAAAAKVAAAKQAAAAANANLIASEEAYNVLLRESAVASTYQQAQEYQVKLKKQLATVEKERIAVSKANAKVEAAITAETVANANIEAREVAKSEAEKVAAKQAGVAADREKMISSQAATAAEVRAAKAQQFLNKTLLSNPYVLAATGLAILVTTLVAFHKEAKSTQDLLDDLNKSIDQIGKQQEINGLIEKYDMLSKNQHRSTEEQKDFNDTIQKLAEIFPEAISQTDQYGKAVDLVKDKLIAANKELRDNLKITTEAQLDADKKHLAELQRQQQEALKAANTGVKNIKLEGAAGAGGVGSLGTYRQTELTPEQIDQERQKVNALQKEIVDLGTKIDEGKKKLAELNSIDVSTAIAPYKELFKDVSEYSQKEAEQVKQKLIDLFMAGTFDENVTKRIQEEINAIDQKLSAKTNTQLLGETQKALEEAKKKLDEMRDPGVAFDQKAIESQEALIKDLEGKIQLITGIKKKEINKQLKAEQDKLKALQELASQELQIRQKLESDKVDVMREGIEKQKKQAEIAYKQQLIDISKSEQQYLKTLNESKGLKSTDKGYITTLPANEQANFNEQRKLAEQKFSQDIAKINYDAAKSIKDIWHDASDDFISEKQREERAVNEKYNALIKKAKELGASQSLIDEIQSKRTAALSKIAVVDWLDAFGELDKLSTASLKHLQDKLRQYIADFGNKIGKDELKGIVRSFNEINDTIERRTPFSTLKESIQDYIYQTKKIEALKVTLELLKQQKNDLGLIAKTERDIENAEKGRAKSLGQANKSLNEIGQQGSEIVGALQGFTAQLEEYGATINDSTKSIIDGVSQELEGLASIDITKPASVITGAIKIITGSLKVWGTIFGANPNELSKSVVESYQRLISVTDELIRKQQDLIATMSGDAAVGAANKTIDLINKQIEASKELGKEFLNSGAGLFSSSHGVKLHDALKQYADDFNKIGINFDSLGGRMTGLFDLTSEQLQLIKEQLPEAWAKLDDSTREYLQNIIDGNTELSDLKDTLNEALTGLSFDSAKSSLEDFLSSTDTTMQDVANNFENYMRKAIANLVIDNLLSGQLKAWYQDFADAMKDNVLSEDEVAKLRAEYEAIYNSGVSARDAAYKAAGIDTTSSTATQLTGSIKSITEDTASALAGLTLTEVTTLKQILDVETNQLNYWELSVGHLEKISKNTAYNVDIPNIVKAINNMIKILNAKL